MHKITFKFESGEDVIIFAAAEENILALARKANVAIDAPCSGNGSCGKCRVKLLEGTVESPPSRHISEGDAQEGWALACGATVSGDAVLMVPDIASAYISRMKVDKTVIPVDLSVIRALFEESWDEGSIRMCALKVVDVKLSPPTLDDTMPDSERFYRAALKAFNNSEIVIPFDILRRIPDLLRENEFETRCVAYTAEEVPAVLDVLPRDDRDPIYGLAVDIGTTTVSAVLVDLESGDIIATGGTGNAQIRYGADVINRIVEQQKPGGVERLQKAIVDETLNPLIDSVCAETGIPRGRIYRMTIAANTTMNHLLLGINANYLRMEPYIPAFFELEEADTSLIGIDLAPNAKMLIAPNIGSYVGGDITAGTMASLLWSSPEMSMLIDLGTNGEIVFGNNEFMMACACSAGPAFEGGDISCGMRAADGAIEACVIDADTLDPALTVISGGKPVGLCGSGLIDVVAELLRTGAIDGKGRFIREGERIRRDEYGTGSYTLAFAKDSLTGRDIALSEVDIDSFIRAKGAIFSAIMSLIKPLGFAPEDIGRVMVAGGIGSGINIKNAIRIGMLPNLPEEKYSYIGNSALSGAYAMLISADAGIEVFTIARNITYLELSAQPGYMDEFIAACFLSP